MKKQRKAVNRIVSVLVAVALAVSAPCVPSIEVHAEGGELTLSQAKALAVANSDKIYSIETKIMAQEAKLKSATKAIALKQKNRSTTRYSPLLKFKYPSDVSGTTKYEEAIKPVQIQTQLDILRHQLNDQKLEEYKKVSDLFVTIVSTQDKIAFNQKRIESYEAAIEKNKARLLLGEAKQADIDTMEAKIQELKLIISNDTSTMETAKKKLSQLIDVDVSTRYTFENPFIKSELPREALPELQQYTLDNDQTYYSACVNETEGMIAVNAYARILKQRFGKKYNSIAPYVNTALSGQKVQKKAFKSAYDYFLYDIDSKYRGYYKIKLLFFSIKIPKEWFKGELSGIRYIDDDPYAMMDLTLDYVDKRLEKEQTEQSVLTQVEDQFNTYVSVKKAYLNYVNMVENAKEQLDKDVRSNRLGEMTYAEYQSSQDSYESLQNDLLQYLADYSSALLEFDRLTCGGVSLYLSGNGLNTFAAGSGTSYIDEEVVDGAYCYVQPIAQQQAFVMSVVMPDEFPIEVTDYELWIDGIQVGERKPVDAQLRHLWIDTQNVETTAFVRVFDGEEAICDCPIDPDRYSNPLKIIKSYTVTGMESDTVGTYTLKQSDIGAFSILHISINEGEKIAFYRMKLDDKYVNGEAFIDVKKDLKYLGALSESMEDIEVEYYDASKQPLFTGYFDTLGLKLKRVGE